MDKYAKIEQLHFNTDINTVDYSVYPSEFPLHWHQYAECLALPKEETCACVSINHQPVTLHTGDILILWPGELHEITDNSDHAIIALQFPPSLLESKKDFIPFLELNRENYLLKYSETPDLNLAIMKDFLTIIDTASNHSDNFRNVKMSISLYEMFIKLASYIECNEGHGFTSIYEYDDNISKKIQEACAYIKSHCAEALSLDDVAEYIGFSSYYLSRHFKRLTTHSFVEYLTLQRISRFQTLLSDKSISITAAAYQAGFKSISTLNRCFLKYCGCSPREYRHYFIL